MMRTDIIEIILFIIFSFNDLSFFFVYLTPTGSIHFLGKRKVAIALQPQSLEAPGGAVTLILGPTANCTFCLPKLVTPEIIGVRKNVEVFVCQFSVSSTLRLRPAPVFQL